MTFRSSQLSYWSLLCSIVAMPLYVVRGHLGFLPITLLEVSIIITFSLWVIEHLWQWQKVTLPSTYWMMWSLLFLVAATISLVISPHLRDAAGIYKAYIIEPMLLFFVFCDRVDTPARWRGVVMALLASTLPVIVVGLSQMLFAWPDIAPAELAQGRISSLYNTANAVGLFLGPLVGLAVLWGYDLANRQYSRFLVLCGTVAVAGLLFILMSKSKGAVAGVVAMVVVFGLLRTGVYFMRLRPHWMRYTTLMAVGILTSYALVVAILLGVVNHPPVVANPYTRPHFTTFTVRQCTWQGTLIALKSSPILGLGLSGFTSNYLAHRTCDAEPLVYPHTLVLNFISELGLLGGLAIFGLCGLVLSQIFARFTSMGTAVGWWPILAFAYWLTHGLVDVPYFKNDLSVLWWIVLASAVVLPRIFVQHDQPLVVPKLSRMDA